MALYPKDWPRVREIFDAALMLPPTERPAYLSTACGSETTIREQVEQLLDAHDRAGSFLEGPALPFEPATSARSFEGERLGPYEVQSRIGAGGMGDVYKARDTRLDRTVAVKVLRAPAAAGAHARDRFEREARAVAALNHPHICTLHDIGHHDSGTGQAIDYLVMEYLQGESLADRLVRGALPIDPALQLAVQIASALDRAHCAGIVHRDLKPGNIFLVRSAGASAPTAKLLDFGLAKAQAPAITADQTRVTFAPELTTPGMILGTVQYMAPEQVEGKPTDARTDLFAFGAVLHEMLSGQKAFTGTSHASMMAAILDHEPVALGALLPSTPRALERVVRRCLAKDPEDRWQSARDLTSELQWIAEAGPSLQAVAGTPRTGPGTRERLAWGTAAMLALALGVASVILRPSPPVVLTPKHFVVPLPPVELTQLGRGVVMLPDGSGLAYARELDSGWRLDLYTLGDRVSRPFPGTEGAASPFFSPDGKWLGFFQDGRLKKMATRGGPAITICSNCSVTWDSDVSWGADDRIAFVGSNGLMQVSASGGAPQTLTTLASGEAAHRHPHFLPGGKAVVFTIVSTSGAMEDAAIGVVTVANRARRILLTGGATPRYVRTGHLVYVRQSDLLAVAFDSNRLTVAGTPFLAVSGLRVRPQLMTGQFDISADGTLAYLPGEGAMLERTLVWVDRKGTMRSLPVPPRPYTHPGLLPEGRGLIVEIEETPHNIWRFDLPSGVLTALTRESANHRPVLSPDGASMVFSSDRTVPRSLFRQATDGSGTAERITEATHPQNPTSWSPVGGWLAFTETHPETKDDIWVLPLDGDRRPKPFVQTRASEQSAVFSPDGRWIAYSSDESGRREVLVTAFPGPGPRKQVSTRGGELPFFSRDGRKVFYRLGDQIFAADMVTGPAPDFGPPYVAFANLHIQLRNTGLPNFVLGPTDDTLLAVKEPEDDTGTTKVHVVVNWFEELRRLAAK